MPMPAMVATMQLDPHEALLDTLALIVGKPA
jgi:hypothetical protein